LICIIFCVVTPGSNRLLFADGSTCGTLDTVTLSCNGPAAIRMPTETEINELFKDVDSLRYEVRRTFAFRFRVFHCSLYLYLRAWGTRMMPS
jgi:hypothetical protein